MHPSSFVIHSTVSAFLALCASRNFTTSSLRVATGVSDQAVNAARAALIAFCASCAEPSGTCAMG